MKLLQSSKQELLLLLSRIKKNGGLTTSNGIDILELKDGYAVGLLGKQIVLSNDEIENISLLSSTTYDLLSIKLDNQCMGYWIHKNVLYIDIVSIQDTFTDAMKLARIFNQKEIYSFKNNKCYTVIQGVEKTFKEMIENTKNGGFKK